jgi:antitoxin component of RelBE/YafQ-DinJ toxin-antitoxin module
MAARGTQLNLRLSEDEAKDVQQAAEECGLSTSEWARLVLTHAAGRRRLNESLERASKAGPTLFRSAVSELDGEKPKAKAKRAAALKTL